MRLPHPRPVVAIAVALGLSLSGAQAAQATTQPVAGTYFGVHMTGVGSGAWPAAPVGSVRLWDTGTSWRDLEPSPGGWNFATLDRAVDTARAHGAQPVLVLGQSPAWASSRPSQPGMYGAGAAAHPRSEAAWSRYVTTVVRRYKGRIGAYEVWNEPNLPGFYTGTPAQMARLGKLTRAAVRSVDPSARVLSPGFATRGGGDRRWLGRWAKAGGGRHVDVMSLHLYPGPTGTPEDSMSLLRASRAVLAASGVRKPVWNTEVNYGMPFGGGQAALPLSAAKQAAYVVRTYLLNRANGVDRVYWYSWDGRGILGVVMSGDDRVSAAAPGRAFGTVSSWMRGARLRGCSTSPGGTTTCRLAYARGTGTVVWNARRTVSVKAPKGTKSRVSMLGVTSGARAGSTMRVGPAPVLLRTTR